MPYKLRIEHLAEALRVLEQQVHTDPKDQQEHDIQVTLLRAKLTTLRARQVAEVNKFFGGK